MKKVVIIGGGFAGSHAAKALESKFEVTLIDCKDFFEFTPSILRTIVEPGHIKKIQVLHRHYLKRAKILRGEVDQVSKDHVVLKKKKIPFDYLLIMTGSKYGTPIKSKDLLSATRANELRAHHRRLNRSKTVLIIGGGLVGVELAAEVIEHYPGKEVIICQSGDKILNRNTPKVIKYAEKWLTKRGVKILYNSKIVASKGNVHKTEQGQKIKADMTFLCVGIVPNSHLMQKHFKKSIAKRGHLKVLPTLQLDGGPPNIFVAGDVTDILEEKTAQNAELQAKVVVDNIKRMERGEKLGEYVSKPRFVAISLGSKHGVLTRGTWAFTGRIPGWFKGVVESMEMRKYG